MLTCSHIFHAGCVQILCLRLRACRLSYLLTLQKVKFEFLHRKNCIVKLKVFFIYTYFIFIDTNLIITVIFFLSTPCTETYSELCQISKMGLYAKIVNGWEYTSDKILRLMLPTYICLFKVRNIVKSLCYFVNINLNATCKLHSILSVWFLAEPK